MSWFRPIFIENLETVIILTSCGGTPNDTVLKSTRTNWSVHGMTKNKPTDATDWLNIYYYSTYRSWALQFINKLSRQQTWRQHVRSHSRLLAYLYLDVHHHHWTRSLVAVATALHVGQSEVSWSASAAAAVRCSDMFTVQPGLGWNAPWNGMDASNQA